MRGKFKSWFLGCAGVLACLLISCGRERKPYTAAIPEDAALVIAFDARQLAEKSGIAATENDGLRANIKEALATETNPQTADLWENFFLHPSESGLDFNEKIYLYTNTGSTQFALLAAVRDAEKLAGFVQKLSAEEACGELQQSDGMNVVEIPSRSVMVFNDDALLILTSEDLDDSAQLKEQAMGRLTAVPASSYMSTDDFARLSKSRGDIVVAASLESLPQKQASLLLMNLPKSVSWNDVSGIFSLSFEKGQLTLDVETLYKSPELQKLIAEQEKRFVSKLSGKFLDKFPANSALYAALACKGKEWYQELMEDESLKAQIASARLPFDMQTVCESLEGEMAMAFSGGLLNLQAGVYAEVENEEILKALDGYTSVLNLLQVNYGVNDGVFYLTNISQPLAGRTLEDVAWKHEVKGKWIYMNLNISGLRDLVSLWATSSQIRTWNMCAQYFQSLTFSAEDLTHSQLVLKTVDADSNVLKQFLDILAKLANLS